MNVLSCFQHPMDLAKIEHKLNEKMYSSSEEFVEDFSLMFDNCHAYNGNNSG